ncbi:hypothetical protein DYB31_009054 [Aphanomyces astaci]|uniref:Endonuclease/exonuclease/phosphatase domain-containing protein n=1 Tax=Aphanomyces astaci TaxID=112090 RepID=A0A397F6D5_APHAT|nr:hypothetical protein DYB31_009054 [Aphanomyces astaci]
MVVRTLWDDVPVYFHNVYAPVIAHSRASFFDDLPRDFEDGSIHFVGGDFNLPLDDHLDAARARPDHNAGKAECIAWLTALGVMDAWRMHHPTDRVYSGPGRSNRLDYLFVDHAVLAQTYSRSSYTLSSFAGDHMEHTVVLSSEQRDPDRSYWRLPRELLKNPQVVSAIKAEANLLLEDMCSDDSQNHGAKWYGWLKRVKKRLQVSHRHHVDSMKYTLNSLKMKWLTSRRAFEMGHVDAQAVKAARQSLDTARSEYRQFHLDQQFDFHANVNERGSSHFFRRPKGIKVPLSSLTIDNVTTTDPTEVKAGFTAHWKSIMTTPRDQPLLNRARRRAIIQTIKRRLTADQRQTLDSPLTADELCGALKSMNPNKSPGPDGWPAAFFQVAPEVFSKILLKVFNYQLTQHGQLLLQQRRSAVALLFKAGDRGNPGNYRPITLMWCRNGAGNGFHSLKDFFTRQGTWPTKTAFVNRLSSNNPAAQVQLLASGEMGFAAPERAGTVYSHLTNIFDQIIRTFAIRAGTALPHVAITSHPFQTVVKDQVIPFELWPMNFLSQIAYHAPSDGKPHPVKSPSRSEQSAISKYVRLIRKTCRLSPPVHGDVWFRLLFKMLPVNSRLYYLQPQQPDVICCVYGDCDAVENYLHAFHTCHHNA